MHYKLNLKRFILNMLGPSKQVGPDEEAWILEAFRHASSNDHNKVIANATKVTKDYSLSCCKAFPWMLSGYVSGDQKFSDVFRSKTCVASNEFRSTHLRQRDVDFTMNVLPNMIQGMLGSFTNHQGLLLMKLWNLIRTIDWGPRGH